MINSQQKRNAYFVGGISGVGKSTFLSKLEKVNDDFEIIYGSKYFIKWLGLKDGDYDTLQSMPEDIKNKELDKMMKHILNNKQNKKTLLIDAHYLRIHRGKISDATGDWVRFFNGLFVLNCAPKEVLRRMSFDILNEKKIRKTFPVNTSNNNEKLKLLSYYLDITIDKAKELSDKFNIPYFIIQNKRDKIKETVKEFVAFTKTVDKQINL